MPVGSIPPMPLSILQAQSWPVPARSTGSGTPALVCLATGIGTLLPIVVLRHMGLLLSAAIFGESFLIGPNGGEGVYRKDLPEASLGRSVALFTTAFAIGQTIGPVAAGAIADTQPITMARRRWRRPNRSEHGHRSPKTAEVIWHD